MQRNTMQYDIFGLVHTGSFWYNELSIKEREDFYYAYKDYLSRDDLKSRKYDFGNLSITVMKFRPYMYIKADFIKVVNSIIVSEKDYSTIMAEIESYIRRKEHLYLQRVDLRYDVRLETQEMANTIFSQYKKALSKFNGLVRLEEHKQKDITDETLYYKRNSNQESLRINIYNKFEERKNKGKDSETYERIIRYEIQLMNKHLVYKNRRGLLKVLDNYLKKDIVNNYMKKYISPFTYEGDFYKYEDIVKMISEKEISRREKEKVLKFIRTIEKGNMDVARDEYSYYHYNKYINFLNGEKINPIPLAADSPYKSLRNPLYFLTEQGEQRE